MAAFIKLKFSELPMGIRRPLKKFYTKGCGNYTFRVLYIQKLKRKFVQETKPLEREFDVPLNPTNKLILAGKIDPSEYTVHAIDVDGSEPSCYMHAIIRNGEPQAFYSSENGVWNGDIMSAQLNWWCQVGVHDILVGASFDDTEEGVLIGTPVKITVTGEPSPVITEQPSDFYAEVNQPALLSVKASPCTSFQWYEINNWEGAIPIKDAVSDTYIPDTSTPLSIRYYQCELYNENSVTWSDIAFIHVGELTPSIIKDLPDVIYCVAESSLQLEVQAENYNTLTLWIDNAVWNVINYPDSRFTGNLKPNWTKGSRLPTRLTANGDIDVSGKISTLVIQDKPKVIIQPKGGEVELGATYLLHIETEEQGSYITETYQWKRMHDLVTGYTPIKNSTDSILSIVFDSLEMSGDRFICECTNQLGTTTTAEARVFIKEPVT